MKSCATLKHVFIKNAIAMEKMGGIMCGMELKRHQTPPLTDFARRVQIAAKARGIENPSQLGRKLKISAQLAHKYWRGDTTNPAAKDLFRLADALEVGARWLLLNEGGPTQREKLTPDESKCLVIFRQLGDGWRDDWLEQGQRILDRTKAEPSAANPFPNFTAKDRR